MEIKKIQRTEVDEAASGKLTIRRYVNDQLTQETHRYKDCNEIALIYGVSNGAYVDESYLRNANYITKKEYISMLSKYPDMPMPGRAPQFLMSMRRALNDEHKKWILDFDAHVKNFENGKGLDIFCMNLLSEPHVMDVLKSQNLKKIKLGELGFSRLKTIISGYKKNKAKKIILTGANCPDSSKEALSFSGMIIELPLDDGNRRDIFLLSDKLAREFGFDGPFDDGQRFLFLKFD